MAFNTPTGSHRVRLQKQGIDVPPLPSTLTESLPSFVDPDFDDDDYGELANARHMFNPDD